MPGREKRQREFVEMVAAGPAIRIALGQQAQAEGRLDDIREPHRMVRAGPLRIVNELESVSFDGEVQITDAAGILGCIVTPDPGEHRGDGRSVKVIGGRGFASHRFVFGRDAAKLPDARPWGNREIGFSPV